MDIQKRISNITEYFKGFEIVDKFIVIKVSYKDKWITFPSTDDAIKITIDDNIPNLYFYYGDLTIDYNLYFDLIEKTIKYNLEREDKVTLLFEKVRELKTIFENEDIETLKTLNFNYKKKKIRAKLVNKCEQNNIIKSDTIIKDIVKNELENNNKILDDSPITIIKGNEIDKLY